MSSIPSIATSGLLAAQPRLQVSAGNVANVNSGGSLPPASAGGGAKAAVINPQPSSQASNPTTPRASSGGGQVAAPNVELTNELLQQQIAQIEFASNVQIAQVYSQIAQNLVNITA